MSVPKSWEEILDRINELPVDTLAEALGLKPSRVYLLKKEGFRTWLPRLKQFSAGLKAAGLSFTVREREKA